MKFLLILVLAVVFQAHAQKQGAVLNALGNVIDGLRATVGGAATNTKDTVRKTLQALYHIIQGALTDGTIVNRAVGAIEAAKGGVKNITADLGADVKNVTDNAGVTADDVLNLIAPGNK